MLPALVSEEHLSPQFVDALEHGGNALPHGRHTFVLSATSGSGVISNERSGLGKMTKQDTVRRVSRDGSALSHPAPDLQALYLGNIERLERSAERMSISMDIEAELKRMREEQKRSDSRRSSVISRARQFSASQPASASPLNLNTVGFEAGMSSDVMELPSPSTEPLDWSWINLQQPAPSDDSITHAPEPHLQVHPMDSPVLSEQASKRSLRLANPSHPAETNLANDIEEKNVDAFALERRGHPMQDSRDTQLQRPTSAGSGDTYRQQATSMFADFDGVHTDHHIDGRPIEQGMDRNTQIARSDSMNGTQPLPPSSTALSKNPALYPEGMVYYPAPVPMMLNLPQKLSKPSKYSDREKRKSEVATSTERRKSQLLSGMFDNAGDPSSAQNAADMPAQLRASMFFEYPPVHQNLQLTGGSAVATLDSILDAAAFAPVSAFTDHPIVGHVGPEVYGSSAANRRLPLSEVEAADISGEGTPLSHPEHNLEVGEDYFDGAGNKRDGVEEDISEEVFMGKPTTLLAELQLRKREQKSRNRTAATVVHSTLLQLDAVAQHQKQTRQHKHVKLAWEDPGNEDTDNEDDEVPLGMLYPGVKVAVSSRYEEDRPLGLLAQRSLEDDEPLSQRRARLRADAKPEPLNQDNRASMYTLDIPGLEEGREGGGDDEEEETLAQRLQRLRGNAPSHARPISAAFTSEVIGELADLAEAQKAATPAESKTPDLEETLRQRSKRLQTERQAKSREVSGSTAPERPPVQQNHSMADVLQAHPASYQSRPHEGVHVAVSNTLLGQVDRYHAPNAQPHAVVAGHGIAGSMPNHGFRGADGNLAVSMNNQSVYANPMMQYRPGMGYQQAPTGIGYPGMTSSMAPAQVPAQTGQRDMVDRWRQSVMH